MNRQDRNCSTRPEIVGPIAGATEMAMLMLPITTPRRSTGTRVSTVVISSGIITAVPEAWTMRAGSSSQKPGEIAANRVPAENRLMARPKTVRVDSRCSRKPVVGMTMAIVSMNAVVSHCPVRALTERSAISRGRATPMIVSLRMTTNAATSRVPMIRRDCAGSLSAGACGRDAVVTMSAATFVWKGQWAGPRRRVLKIRLRSPGELIARCRGNLTRSRYEGPLTVRNGFRRKGNRAPRRDVVSI